MNSLQPLPPRSEGCLIQCVLQLPSITCSCFNGDGQNEGCFQKCLQRLGSKVGRIGMLAYNSSCLPTWLCPQHFTKTVPFLSPTRTGPSTPYRGCAGCTSGLQTDTLCKIRLSISVTEGWKLARKAGP